MALGRRTGIFRKLKTKLLKWSKESTRTRGRKEGSKAAGKTKGRITSIDKFGS